VKRHLLISAAIVLTIPHLALARVQDSAEKMRTINTLIALRMALRYYHEEYGSLPKGDSSAILAALTATSIDAQNPRRIVFFEFRPPRTRYYFWTVDRGDRHASGNAMDGWGRPLVWIIDPAGAEITVKSLGKNGKDDGGKPDDLVIIIQHLPEPTVSPNNAMQRMAFNVCS
jgi:hypothetical protein